MGVLEFDKRTNRIYSELECHYHSVYEIYYFISGDADIMVDGKLYKLTPYSLVLIAPNVLHGIQVNSRADYVRHVLFIPPAEVLPERTHLLKKIMPDHKKNPKQEIFYEHIEDYHLEDFFYHIKQLDKMPEETKNLLEPVFIEALLAQINVICNALRPARLENQTPDHVMEVINYINLHLTESLSLDAIADHFFISKNHLNKNFKQYLGTTLGEYIRFKRVVLAKQYMENGESAMNAALQAGFADYSSFYRAFVKFMKSTPRENVTNP